MLKSRVAHGMEESELDRQGVLLTSIPPSTVLVRRVKCVTILR
jgi:hypothetical protein